MSAFIKGWTMVRVLLAGLIGGFLMFFAGAFCHMVLNLESRFIEPVDDEARLHDFLVGQNYAPGMYGYPMMPKDMSSLPAEEQAKVMAEIFDKFKAGPAAYIVIPPKGEDAMGPKQLVGELLADIGAAMFAALIVSCLTPTLRTFERWLLVVAFAPLSWLSLTCSYWLWYRFPWAFVFDGLLAAAIEWSVAGLAIVLLVKRVTNMPQERR